MPKLVPVNCGICGSADSRRLHKIRNLRIVQCRSCSCIYTNPRYSGSDEGNKIALEEKLSVYQEHYWPKRKASAEKFWHRAEPNRKTGYLLDIGCGFGFFLDEARQHGWSVMGVEIAKGEAAWGQEQFGLTIISTLESERLPEHQFDIITLWDAIEHIPDVKALLARCIQLLRPKGLLFLRTPNAEGLTLNNSWWSWIYLLPYRHLVYPANPMQHVYHFTPSVLTKLLQDRGFAVCSVNTDEDWNERVLIGRNPIVSSLRQSFMWLAWKMGLPYEMTVWAEKMS